MDKMCMLKLEVTKTKQSLSPQKKEEETNIQNFPKIYAIFFFLVH